MLSDSCALRKGGHMPDIIQMQSMARSRLDQSKLASFDQEVIEAPPARLSIRRRAFC